MKINLIGLFVGHVFASFVWIYSASAQPVSVSSKNIREFVETKNERVKAKLAESEAASRRQGYLSRSFLPSAEIYGGQEHFKKGPLDAKTQPTFGAEVSFNLYRGGRDKGESERLSLVSERKRHEVRQTLAVEVAKAREAYWHLLYLREYAALLEGALSESSQSLKIALRRIKSGVATESDSVEFEMQSSELKRELEKARLEIANKDRALKLLLGFEAGVILSVDEALAHEHQWEELLRHSEEDHLFLTKPLELYAKESEISARIKKSVLAPSFDVFAGYQQFNQREEEDYSSARDRREAVIGLRARMSFSEGWEGMREAKALRIEARAAEAEANYLRREIEEKLHSEIEELRLLHKQVHEAEENIRRSERYLKMTRSEYGRGVKNSPDMLSAAEKLISIKQKRLEIVRDFQIAKSQVLSQLGR